MHRKNISVFPTQDARTERLGVLDKKNGDFFKTPPSHALVTTTGADGSVDRTFRDRFGDMSELYSQGTQSHPETENHLQFQSSDCFVLGEGKTESAIENTWFLFTSHQYIFLDIFENIFPFHSIFLPFFLQLSL